MSWKITTVAVDGTHHLLDGKPLYGMRFRIVGKFHDPGLAPAMDPSGAYHIGPDGQAAYPDRFIRAWGFYCVQAAVEGTEGAFHVRADGAPAYPERYSWCGNFQEELCTVRQEDNRYLHIDTEGRPVSPDRHLYAGDFKDGVAVVRSPRDGLCRHIDRGGKQVHDGHYLDLDVFHKGYARARDSSGWFHIRPDGQPAYSRRFMAIEPYYNEAALVETCNGKRILIGADGAELLRVDKPLTGHEPRESGGNGVS